MAKKNAYDIVIAGSGLAGLTMAAAANRTGLRTALVAPDTNLVDGRTTALLAHSIEFLTKLEIWPDAHAYAAKMSAMRLVDDTQRLFHAPETTFKASEIGLEYFGYNILNDDLSKILTKTVDSSKHFKKIDDSVIHLDEDGEQVTIQLNSGETITAKVLVGADGRNSTVRQFADHGKGIPTRQWTYPQSALVLNFSHTLHHKNTSTEFHTPSGPFTIVPLKDDVSSLVWVVNPNQVDEIMALSPGTLDRMIEGHMHSILGKTKVTTDIQSFPLSGLRAQKLAKGRCFLIGDAGHGLPPIGAQGFNLAIRDIEVLALLLESAVLDPGRVASQYNQRRNADIMSRTASIDLFNRSLLSDFLPVQAVRSGSIIALNAIRPLRKFMMREGISPGLGIRALREDFRDFGQQINPFKS